MILRAYRKRKRHGPSQNLSWIKTHPTIHGPNCEAPDIFGPSHLKSTGLIESKPVRDIP